MSSFRDHRKRVYIKEAIRNLMMAFHDDEEIEIPGVEFLSVGDLIMALEKKADGLLSSGGQVTIGGKPYRRISPPKKVYRETDSRGGLTDEAPTDHDTNSSILKRAAKDMGLGKRQTSFLPLDDEDEELL